MAARKCCNVTWRSPGCVLFHWHHWGKTLCVFLKWADGNYYYESAEGESHVCALRLLAGWETGYSSQREQVSISILLSISILRLHTPSCSVLIANQKFLSGLYPIALRVHVYVCVPPSLTPLVWLTQLIYEDDSQFSSFSSMYRLFPIIIILLSFLPFFPSSLVSSEPLENFDNSLAQPTPYFVFILHCEQLCSLPFLYAYIHVCLSDIKDLTYQGNFSCRNCSAIFPLF